MRTVRPRKLESAMSRMRWCGPRFKATLGGQHLYYTFYADWGNLRLGG